MRKINFTLVLLSTLLLTSCNFITNKNSSSSNLDDSSNMSLSFESSLENSSSKNTSSNSKTSTSSQDGVSSSPSSSSKEESISSSKSSSSSKASESSSSKSSSSSTSSSSSSTNVDVNISVVNNSSNRLALQIDKGTISSLSYKLSSESSYINLDNECISGTKATILGLKKGNYDVKIKTSENKEVSLNNIAVEKQDMSGYATFNKTTIGAYNIDGSLQANASVIYVNDSNKNNVQLKVGSKTYNGLGNILKNISNITTPLDIRIVGSINTNQFKVKEFTPFVEGEDPSDSQYAERFQNTLETTYTNLDGLTSKIFGPSSSSFDYGIEMTFSKKTSYKDTDSAFNMMSVKNASNLTIEGLFDGTINQWGFNFKECNSIEVRNLTFKDYPEDACSFEGSSKSITSSSNFFLHNNTFLVGKNNWDLTQEQDKHEGDGSSDIKYLSNYTSSYNHFIKCHKTGLVGGGDTQMTQNVTFHHNYYEEVSSRLPLGRQANMHIYNCYYKKCGTGQDIRANAFVFSEANYFENTNYPQKVTKVESNNYYPNIKSYNDILTGCKNASQATVVTSREITVENKCNPNGTDLSSFDTDPSLFYYDSDNKVSKVELLNDAKDVPSFVTNNSGNLYL